MVLFFKLVLLKQDSEPGRCCRCDLIKIDSYLSVAQEGLQEGSFTLKGCIVFDISLVDSVCNK